MDRWRSNGQLVPVAPDVGGGEVPRTNNRAEIFDRIRAREYAPNVDNAALRLPRHTFHFSCPPPPTGRGSEAIKRENSSRGWMPYRRIFGFGSRERIAAARERERGSEQAPSPPPFLFATCILGSRARARNFQQCNISSFLPFPPPRVNFLPPVLFARNAVLSHIAFTAAVAAATAAALPFSPHQIPEPALYNKLFHKLRAING